MARYVIRKHWFPLVSDVRPIVDGRALRGMPVTLNGETWDLIFVERMPPGHEDREGLTVREKKEILILKGLIGSTELEAIIHEADHAIDPSRGEDYITARAHERSVVLWRMGFRRTEQANG